MSAADFTVPKHGLRVIADDVCERHKLAFRELVGPEKKKRISVPRQEFMALAHDTGRFSTTQIGKFCGGRDHTTVVYGIQRHRQKVAEALG